jgi:hypothetical protein
MSRQFVFRNYWWIALLGAAMGILGVLAFTARDRTSLVGSIIAAALAFCYFAQQQKLAEMSLFKELFMDFNRRYDALNDRLLQIARSGGGFDETDRQTIVDYCNLCAEEYLFFSEGYIHREAWRSWCRGMLWYFEREPFQTVWKEEIATNSYYGLSLDVIQQGAA